MPVCGSASEYALPPMCGRRSTTSTRFPSWVATRSANGQAEESGADDEEVETSGHRLPRVSDRIGRNPIWRRGGVEIGPRCNGSVAADAQSTAKVAIASRFNIGTLVTPIPLVPSTLCASCRIGQADTPTQHAVQIVVQIEETSVPNRRRRKLSTAMSAVAALAVASPCAYFLVYESTAGSKPPEHHEFKQAAVMADLPGELMGALSQGLSQFGINLPPVPALTGGGASATGLTSPGLGSPGLTSPGLTSPG